MTAANDSRIDAVASIAGWNIGAASRDLTDSLKYVAAVNTVTPHLWLLHGATANGLLRERMTHVDEWDLMHAVPSLAPKSILLIAAQRDQVAAIAQHHAPLVAALERLNPTRVTALVLDSDHNFSDKRVALTRAILSWLDTQVPR